MRITHSRTPNLTEIVKRILNETLTSRKNMTMEEFQVSLGDYNTIFDNNMNTPYEFYIDNNTLSTLIIICMIVGLVFTIISLLPYKNVFLNSVFLNNRFITYVKKKLNYNKGNILPRKAKESPYIGSLQPTYYKQQLNGSGIVLRVRSPKPFKLPETYNQQYNCETPHETRITIITTVENGEVY
jgi:hypothetical protein